MKQKKFIVPAILLILSLSITFITQPITAAGAVKYAYTKLDKSQTYTGGTMHNYFQYPLIDGSSTGIKKINAALQQEASAFVSKNDYDYEEAINWNYEYFGSKVEYYNTAEGKVIYNSGNIFSVRIQTTWYLGGVGNGDTYGDTFNINTGKKLSVAAVVANAYNPATDSGYKKLRSTISKKLAKQYDQETADNFLSTYNTKKKLKNADFYLNKSGNVVVCFRTYDISYGAAGCLTVTIPGKYKK